MAKSVFGRSTRCRCSTIAQASDSPSKVAVPRPTSSRITRLRPVAKLRMFAVSIISTMNVDSPRARSSLAPTRVKMRSTAPISALAAATKLPAWAISTVSATCRR